MSGKSPIEWTDATWNPVRGCSKVSDGCRNCYAIKTAHRFHGEGKAFDGLTEATPAGLNWTGKVMLVPELLDKPMRWKRPRRIFVNSMSDLFHDDVPEYFIWNVFQTMARCPQHTFQILTKRPERMLRLLENRYWRNFGVSTKDFYALIIEGEHTDGDVPFLPNVWLGVSVENKRAADERIPLLLQTPAAVRFLSCEPLLGQVDLEFQAQFEHPDNEGYGVEAVKGLDWVIAGGESGPGARPMHPDWARSLRDQCQEAGVPFFFKQFGEWIHNTHSTFKSYDGMRVKDVMSKLPNGLTHVDCYRKVGKKKAGRLLDGRTWDEFPEVQA